MAGKLFHPIRDKALVVLLIAVCGTAPQTANLAIGVEPIGDWVFVPDYRLGQRAGNQPGTRIPHPSSSHRRFELQTAELLFGGERPTQRLQNLLPPERIPKFPFTVEMWLCHHVDQPVGAVISVKGKTPGSSVPWSLAFHNWESVFRVQGSSGSDVQLSTKVKQWSGFKERWFHVAATYDGNDARLYQNGRLIGQGHMHHEEVAWPAEFELEMAAYMQNEPFMQWANLVHHVRIHDRILEIEEIAERFESLRSLVEDGKLYPNVFHYTAGPYLNLATQTTINVVWETDRVARAEILWGKSAKLEHSRRLDDLTRLHEITLQDLEPNTNYFYRIRSTDEQDSSIDSGLLTFKTAVREGEPFRFAVVGDTEARPHVNDRLAKLVWGERPNFLINLGDLTDAGMKAHRYEWTHEYFVGMNQLTSRVPVFAVPGNGEADLHWYNHYHRYPEPEGFYDFQFGDAAFFMLDSNQRERDFAPGGKQYEWLKQKLTGCKSKWKIVCHHHATYCGEEDDYGDTWAGPSTFGDLAVQRIVPLYEEYGVDIAMFGHLHLYERSHPFKHKHVDPSLGTIHLLAGGGGGNLEDFAPTPAFFSAKTHRGHHYVMIEIIGDRLSLRMHDTDGDIRDSFEVVKVSPKRLLTIRQSIP